MWLVQSGVYLLTFQRNMLHTSSREKRLLKNVSMSLQDHTVSYPCGPFIIVTTMRCYNLPRIQYISYVQDKMTDQHACCLCNVSLVCSSLVHWNLYYTKNCCHHYCSQEASWREDSLFPHLQCSWMTSTRHWSRWACMKCWKATCNRGSMSLSIGST